MKNWISVNGEYYKIMSKAWIEALICCSAADLLYYTTQAFLFVDKPKTKHILHQAMLTNDQSIIYAYGFVHVCTSMSVILCILLHMFLDFKSNVCLWLYVALVINPEF